MGTSLVVQPFASLTDKFAFILLLFYHIAFCSSVQLIRVMSWRNERGIRLAIDKLWVQFPVGHCFTATLHKLLSFVFLLPSSIIWYWPLRMVTPMAGKVTTSLAQSTGSQ